MTDPATLERFLARLRRVGLTSDVGIVEQLAERAATLGARVHAAEARAAELEAESERLLRVVTEQRAQLKLREEREVKAERPADLVEPVDPHGPLR